MGEREIGELLDELQRQAKAGGVLSEWGFRSYLALRDLRELGLEAWELCRWARMALEALRNPTEGQLLAACRLAEALEPFDRRVKIAETGRRPAEAPATTEELREDTEKMHAWGRWLERMLEGLEVPVVATDEGREARRAAVEGIGRVARGLLAFGVEL